MKFGELWTMISRFSPTAHRATIRVKLPYIAVCLILLHDLSHKNARKNRHFSYSMSGEEWVGKRTVVHVRKCS